MQNTPATTIEDDAAQDIVTMLLHAADRVRHDPNSAALFAFDQFGPLSIRPHHGSAWAPRSHPDRLPATYHRIHGIRHCHGCYSFADDHL